MKLWRWTVNVYIEAETLQQAERIMGAVLDEEFPAWTAEVQA